MQASSKTHWKIILQSALAALVFCVAAPLGYAAALIVPATGSLTATAASTSAISTNPTWSIDGTERYAWNANAWLEYSIDFGASSPFAFSMTAINQNGTPPALPAGYTFNVDVAIDGVWKTQINIPGSTTTYKTGGCSPSTVTLSGIHTVRYTWINDAWSSGQYDANIRVQSISIARQGTADTTPPVISSVASSGISAAGATITWTTNEAATSQVDYGTTTSYGQSTTLDSTLVISHSVPITGLTASTLYHYRVKSKDAAGNLATGTDFTFTTTAPADTTKPTVSLTAPAAAAVIGGSAVSVTANASDNVGVAGVQFKLDGSNLGAEDTVSPYAYTWDTRTALDGAHTLTAVARDAAGNSQTSAAVSVTVDNTAPTLTITSPVEGQIIASPTP